MIKTIAKIEGLMCGLCEAHMNDAVRSSFKVKKVVSSHTKNETVILSDREIGEDKLREVVENTGYKLISFKSEPYEKKSFLFFKK